MSRALIGLFVWLAACAPSPQGATGCLETAGLCRAGERCDEVENRCVPGDPSLDLSPSQDGGTGSPDLGPSIQEEGACSADHFCWAHPLPQGHSITGIWAHDASTAYAVSRGGHFLRWNGVRWAVIAQLPTIGFLDVHGLDPSQIWAVGHSGGVASWNGRELVPQYLPIGSDLSGIWASDANHAWAIGGGGAFFAFDGTAWLGRGGGRDSSDGITGFGSNRMYMVQRRGNLVQWDGTMFTSVTTPTGLSPLGVWAQDMNRVWLAGKGVYLYDGTAWTQKLAGGDFSKIWGADGDHIWALGSTGPIMGWDGKAWTPQDPGTKSSLRSLRGSDAGHVWAGGDNGTIVHFDGARWQPQIDGVPGAVRGIHGQPGGPLFAVCDGGVILRASGGRFTRVPSPSSSNLNSVWVQGPTLAFAVGEAGTILRWDGTAWQSMPSPTVETLNSVWGSDATHVWAVSEGGSVLSYSGASFTLDRRVTTRLSAVWGLDADHVWAATENGKLLTLRGRPAEIDTGAGVRLYGLGGLDEKHLWAVGQNQTIMAFDGTRWTRQTVVSSSDTLRAVFPLDAERVLVVGDDGALLGNRGVFASQQLGYGGALYTAFARPDGRLYVGGNGGTILTRQF
jgi:hypothetical protein